MHQLTCTVCYKLKIYIYTLYPKNSDREKYIDIYIPAILKHIISCNLERMDNAPWIYTAGYELIMSAGLLMQVVSKITFVHF
mgnify:CR=1 FL=1